MTLTEIINSVPFAIVLLVAGFVLLIKGADFFVEGSSGVAKKLRVPSIVIGLTVVAMGTSLPELAVSVSAGLAGNNSLAISNVVGSNIFNLMVVVGMCAVMSPIVVDKVLIKRDIPISIGAAALLLILGIIGMQVGVIDAAILAVLFVAFVSALVVSALKARKNGEVEEEEEDEKIRALWALILFIIGGAAAIICGGTLVVNSAETIATAFGMDDTLFGLTIAAIGTSLPELVTSVVAARKGEVELSLGNAIGSNIFNILLILGTAGILSPMAMLTENIIDIAILIACSLFVWLVAWKKKKLGRIEGIAMVAVYAAFMAYIVIRNYAM